MTPPSPFKFLFLFVCLCAGTVCCWWRIGLSNPNYQFQIARNSSNSSSSSSSSTFHMRTRKGTSTSQEMKLIQNVQTTTTTFRKLNIFNVSSFSSSLSLSSSSSRHTDDPLEKDVGDRFTAPSPTTTTTTTPTTTITSAPVVPLSNSPTIMTTTQAPQTITTIPTIAPSLITTSPSPTTTMTGTQEPQSSSVPTFVAPSASPTSTTVEEPPHTAVPSFSPSTRPTSTTTTTRQPPSSEPSFSPSTSPTSTTTTEKPQLTAAPSYSPSSTSPTSTTTTEKPQLATEIELVEKISGLGQITDIQSTGAMDTSGDDSRLFVVLRQGRIRIVTFENDNENKDATVSDIDFLDISDRVRSSSGEQGLLGLAFHPNYYENGHFFVNYSSSNGATTISRFTVSVNSNIANPNSEVIVKTIDQPYGNHNGGQIHFSPSFPRQQQQQQQQQYLYIATGDGGSGGDPENYGQNVQTTLLGKILRVDVDNVSPLSPEWAIPNDNPFVINDNIDGDSSNDDTTAIWAYGLRNPWRFSFDKLTGDMYIADVGQGTMEEINFQRFNSTGGENYAWRPCEGTHTYKPKEIPDLDGNGDAQTCTSTTQRALGWIPPILEYDHSVGTSITGGYVYRGTQYTTQLNGTYFYADYGSHVLFGARRQPSTTNNDNGEWINTIEYKDSSIMRNPSTFGQSSTGELYIGTLGGALLRIQPVVSDSRSSANVVPNDDTKTRSRTRNSTLTESSVDGSLSMANKLEGVEESSNMLQKVRMKVMQALHYYFKIIP